MENLKPEQRRLITILRMSGIFFAILGVVFLLSPEVVLEFTNFDKETSQIMGGAFLFVAVIDILFVPEILKKGFINQNDKSN